MVQSMDEALLALVGDYLAREITLSEVEDFLAPRLGAIMTAPRSKATVAAGECILGISEMADGIQTEEGLRARLAILLGPPYLGFPTVEARVHPGRMLHPRSLSATTAADDVLVAA